MKKLDDYTSYKNVINILIGPELKVRLMKGGMKRISEKLTYEAIRLAHVSSKGISLPDLTLKLRKIRILNNGRIKLYNKIYHLERKENGL